jgi:hypothetical protein
MGPKEMLGNWRPWVNHGWLNEIDETHVSDRLIKDSVYTQQQAKLQRSGSTKTSARREARRALMSLSQ